MKYCRSARLAKSKQLRYVDILTLMGVRMANHTTRARFNKAPTDRRSVGKKKIYAIYLYYENHIPKTKKPKQITINKPKSQSSNS